MKKKVLFIINDLRMGGAQRVLSTMMNALFKDGYQVSVVTNHPVVNDFFKIDSRIGRYVTDLYLPSNGFFNAISNNIRRILKIRKFVSSESPDTVFSFMTETNIITLLACLMTDQAVVISERSDPGKENKTFIWALLRKISYRKASVVTSNSKATLEYLEAIVKSDRLTYLPNPVITCDLAEDVAEESNKIILLLVARLHHAKGIDILIEAISQIKTAENEFEVWVAGDGPEKEELKRVAIAHEVDDRIQWLGKVQDLMPLYRSATIFILPSRREGMPNALLEAMSCGLPVIVSDASPGPLEFVIDGKTGIVFESGSSAALALAIDELLADKGKAQKMGIESSAAIAPFMLEKVLPVWKSVINLNDSTGNKRA